MGDQQFYDRVAQEIKAGIKHDGLYVRALSDAMGDKNKGEAIYVKLRVKFLKEELKVESQRLKEEKIQADKDQKVRDKEEEAGFYKKKQEQARSDEANKIQWDYNATQERIRIEREEKGEESWGDDKVSFWVLMFVISTIISLFFFSIYD